MMLKEQTQKYYKGKLTFINNVQEHSRFDNISRKELSLMERCPFGDELSDGNGENDFAVLDDVNTVKNVMVFVEINRYRETLLLDMQEGERSNVISLIIDNLNKFHVKPVAYEVKADSIVVAWYLNTVINTFRFSESIEALVDFYEELENNGEELEVAE
ncbi:hypothetical protein [Cytobacillus firmus]|uniref:hypothetical protein n=1 Tax=Cytobacillus firmus TaxID=1399 RepID=UPI0018CEC2EF|nr:hypothetical protein [Cytobacillus firmus]MBG9587989.1 hypothetical protein [Cytobacillus firmus]